MSTQPPFTRLTTFLLCIAVLASQIAGIGTRPCLAAEEGSKEVLVLHSYHAGLKWTDDVMAGSGRFIPSRHLV